MARVILTLFYTLLLSDTNISQCHRLLQLLNTLNIQEVKQEVDVCQVMLRFATGVLSTDLSNQIKAEHKSWNYETLQFFEQIAENR